MQKQKTISQFLSSHLWQMIVIVVSGMIAFTWLRAEVKNLITRVDAIERKQAEYPSKAWFELKFDTIDSNMIRMEKKIDTNTEQINSL